ncbi:MAG: HAD family hydrolase [Lachnospiraceae bacterium]|nr:HAD family hydrolase [Lachnospiraceae bacterium]
MNKKAVIFDLDGTLTDTLKSIWKSANLALADVDLPPIELDRYRYFVGDGEEELLKRALAFDGDKELRNLEKIRLSYRKHFETYVNYEVKPYEGIKELLQALKEKSIKLCVNSNKPHDRAIDVVQEMFGQDCFDMIVGQSKERQRKPAPDGVFYIMESLSLSKEEVIYLGDTGVDMQTGRSAGVFTVGALWGFRDREELTQNKADAIIAHPMELLDYL